MPCDIHMRVEVRRPPTPYASIPTLAAEMDLTQPALARLVGVEQHQLDALISGNGDAISSHQLRVLGRAIGRSSATFVPRWHLLGPVFESRRDWAMLDATPELMRALSDGELLDALTDHVKAEPSEFRDQLAHAEDASAVLERFSVHAAQMARDKRRVDRLRGRLEPDRFAELTALEARLRRERRAPVELQPRHRAAIVEAALRTRYGSGEDADRLLLVVHRAQGDPPFPTASPWEGRDLDLFAALADVCNGDPSGALRRVDPIAGPRGVPHDISTEGRAFMERWVPAAHSHTYLTLAELQAVDWDEREVTEWIVLDGDRYLRARCGGGLAPARHARAEADLDHDAVLRQFTADGFEAWLSLGSPYIPRPHAGQQHGDVFIDAELLRRLIDGEIPEVSVEPEGTVLDAGELVAVHDRPPERRAHAETPQAVLRRKLLQAELTPEQFDLALGDAKVVTRAQPGDIVPIVLASATASWTEALSPDWFEHTLVQLEQQIPAGGTAADVRLVCFFTG